MRALLIAMATGGALALAGCQTSQNVSKICSDIDRDHKAFVAIADTGLVKGSIVQIEGAAYKSTVPICADSDDVTLVDAVTLAANAYAEIKSALDQAKSSN